MDIRSRLWILAIFGISWLFSCAGFKNWDKYEKYQADKDFSRKKYEQKLIENKINKSKKNKDAQNKESFYEKEVKDTIVKLLKEPPAPVKMPDTILRVLILPYVSDRGSLNASKYVFLKVEEGRWILGDYLIENKKGVKILTPLKERKSEGK